MHANAASRTFLPAGHAEGWVETFRELYRAVYTAVAAGGATGETDYPTFADGHRENVLADAIALSNGERRWVEVEG
jgi:predicted dehydrogenase